MMSTALAAIEEHLPSLEPRNELTREEVDLIKATICKGATDTELALFIKQCNRTGLDPFSRQIHAVKRWDAKEKRDVMTIQVGIDGFRLIADRTGRYVPGREPELRYDKQGTLASATAYVKKMVAGEWHEIAATAYYEEYCQRNREGDPTAQWAKMPRAMLSKAAECLALRKAFPAEMRGLYSPEEMGQADNPARVILTPAGRVDSTTGEVLPPAHSRPSAALPPESQPTPAAPVTAKSRKDRAIAEIRPLLMELASGKYSLKDADLGPGLLAIKNAVRTQGCKLPDVLFDFISAHVIEAAIAEVTCLTTPSVEGNSTAEATRELEKQMDAAISSEEEDPFADE